MQLITVSLLAALVAGTSAASVSHRHAAAHAVRSPVQAVPVPRHRLERKEFAKRPLNTRATAHISAEHASQLMSIGFAGTGINAEADNGSGCWIGKDGSVTNKFTNNHEHPITVVVWGPWKSWVNANQPEITMSLGPGESKTVSFSDNFSGGWAAVGPKTTLNDWGQIKNTWGEITTGAWGTFDVSREVYMDGAHMSIHGDNCESTMDKCVFQCDGGVLECMEGYSLVNCEAGSQPGAVFGLYAGAASGGCQSAMPGSHLRTHMGKKHHH